MAEWVKIDKWHRLDDDEAVTRCGQDVDIVAIDKALPLMPLGEDTCEECLRLAEHDKEKAEVT